MLIGKTQYRLLLAQWEKSHAIQELTSVVGEVRLIRASEANAVQKLEEAESEFNAELISLKKKLSDCLMENDRLRQDVASNFTPERAHALSNQIEEIAVRKSALEKDLAGLRGQKAGLATQLEEAKMTAKQAQELLQELKVGPPKFCDCRNSFRLVEGTHERSY